MAHPSPREQGLVLLFHGPAAVILECPFDRLSTAADRFRNVGLPAFPAAPLLLFWGGVQQGFSPFRLNRVDYARSVRPPTLLMHGDQDPSITMEEARSILAHLAGPRTLVVFPGARHELYTGADRLRWTNEVSRFLARRRRETAGSGTAHAASTRSTGD